jgi:membrane protein DedA with SNARE-associated domain
MLGDNLGYGIGRYLGMKALLRHGSRFGWTESRIKVGRYLFARFGVLAVFLGRFVALVRALAAILAGVNRMPWFRFLPANALGCLVWSAVVTQSGYAMGTALDSAALAAAPQTVGLAGICIVIVVILLLKTVGGRLMAAADRAYPGPLEA